MPNRDQLLLDYAFDLGVTIEYAPLRQDRDGQYTHARKTIRLREGMHARQHRSVLAHEIAHAIFGDTPSKHGPVNAKQEARADMWAARFLIDTEAYAAAEAHCEGHAGAMALELGVMRSVVDVYRARLLRLDDTVYLDPKMGPGQWALKIPTHQ